MNNHSAPSDDRSLHSSASSPSFQDAPRPLRSWEYRASKIAIITACYAASFHDAYAAATLSTEAVADTFLTSDPETGGGTGASRANADSDNSGFGAMMISAHVTDPVQGVSYPRTMHAFVAFNTASIKAGFDAQYGIGQWHITDVSVKLYSNFSIPGVPANNNQFNVPNPGYFTLSWISNDTWLDPATAGPAGRTRPDLTWNNRGKYLDGAIIESVSPAGGFYWTGGDYNGTTACGGGTFAPAAPPCFSSFWPLEKTSNLTKDILTGGIVSLMGTPADEQVVYLINQLTKPDAHPQIFVTADVGAPAQTPPPAPTATPLPTPSATPVPTSSPAPEPSPTPSNCTLKVPQIDPLQREWLVRAGQTLGFTVTAYDCQTRPTTIKGKKLPPDAIFTQSFDRVLGRQKALFTWTPPVTQVGRTRLLQFKAAVKTARGMRFSPIQSARVQILPPLLGNAGSVDAPVSKLFIKSAIWNSKSGQLELRGLIRWHKRTPRSVKAAAVGQPIRIIDIASNAVLLETQADLSGRWRVSISLPAGNEPAGIVEAEFGDNVSLPKKVRKAP